jgi:hypothetical protein
MKHVVDQRARRVTQASTLGFLVVLSVAVEMIPVTRLSWWVSWSIGGAFVATIIASYANRSLQGVLLSWAVGLVLPFAVVVPVSVPGFHVVLALLALVIGVVVLWAVLTVNTEVVLPALSMGSAIAGSALSLGVVP